MSVEAAPASLRNTSAAAAAAALIVIAPSFYLPRCKNGPAQNDRLPSARTTRRHVRPCLIPDVRMPLFKLPLEAVFVNKIEILRISQDIRRLFLALSVLFLCLVKEIKI